jgi:hypothetical protein
MNQPPEPIEALIESARTGVIRYELLTQIANAMSISASELLDSLALHVAKQYENREMSFEDADAVMNAAFASATSQEHWTRHESTIPPFMFEVYQAFDEGEYLHPGDQQSVDTELKYTRPLIAGILARKHGA